MPHEITNPLYFTFGVIVTVLALNMLREKNARRIRNSQYWWMGWLGYLLLLGIAGRLVCGSLK